MIQGVLQTLIFETLAAVIHDSVRTMDANFR
jgi:hypothetical protein